MSPSFFSDLEFSSPNKVKLIPVEPAGEISPSPSFVPEIQFTKLEHGINKEAKVAVVPLPIFWITIASILLLVIVGVWLFWELQAQKYNASIEEAKQIALVEIAATGTAENRVTATQETITQNATHTAEARFIVAATSTVVQAATDIAATTTTEFKATSTAERIATANIEATHIASTAGTATAEKIATLNAHATQVTEQHATSTAESIATKAAAATSSSTKIK